MTARTSSPSTTSMRETPSTLLSAGAPPARGGGGGGGGTPPPGAVGGGPGALAGRGLTKAEHDRRASVGRRMGGGRDSEATRLQDLRRYQYGLDGHYEVAAAFCARRVALPPLLALEGGD